MGEHFNITMGQSPKGETYNEEGEGIAFFQGRRDFGFRYPDVRVYTTDPKRFAKAGDTLISVRAPVGDKNMAAIDCCIGRGVAAIKHKSDSRSFTYAFMSHIEKKLGDSGSSGTVFSSINQKELKKVSFVAPPQKLIEAFHKIVDPIDQKVEVLSKEIESLSSLRDTLLPKLLSGEIELEGAGVVEENDVVNRLLKQMDFGVKFRPRQESIPEGSFGYIRLSGTFGSDGGTFVSIPKAVQALTKITSADGIYGEIAGNAMTENVLSGTVEIVTNNIIPLGVLNKICTAVFGKKTPIKSRNAVLLTSIHQAKNKTLDGIMNEQAKRFAFLEQSTMDEQEFGESLRYLESIGVVKCEGQHIALLDTIVQH
uniref:restriction endonuclease subunit S n=1 Tax=Photobacterium leiognathi TaxID=553611 RepID=UPI00387F98CD